MQKRLDLSLSENPLHDPDCTNDTPPDSEAR
nr:MAG TPA: hypothetical protein [Caudoviricetes sp.]